MSFGPLRIGTHRSGVRVPRRDPPHSSAMSR
jgi:hypothetical protein